MKLQPSYWLCAVALLVCCGGKGASAPNFAFVLPAGKTLTVVTTDRNDLIVDKLGTRTQEQTVRHTLKIVEGGVLGRDKIRALVRMTVVGARWKRGDERQSWKPGKPGKIQDEVSIAAAMHKIEYEAVIAADYSVTVTGLKRLPLDYQLGDFAKKFRRNTINAKMLAVDLQSGVSMLPRGSHRVGSKWTTTYASHTPLSMKKTKVPIDWTLESRNRDVVVTVGKIRPLTKPTGGKLRLFEVRVTFDVANKRPLGQLFNLEMKMPTGAVKNQITTSYQLK